MLVLARLSDAQREGHPILGLIKGSAVNQDGASNGLTAPNGPSQERVIRQALANARLAPEGIDLLEAHGTGTTLGDPIEAGALLATYGQEREQPLYLGSIKSNIGHTQAAAGVAGVIKALLAMREGVMPKTLHVDAPSSKVDWEAGKIELLTEERPWEADGRPRRAAVSSFGISGTNAHLILEGAPEPVGEGDSGASGEGAPSEQIPIGDLPFVLTAKSTQALQAQAGRLADHLAQEPEISLQDLSYSLVKTRTAMEHRAALITEDREELLGSLRALAKAEDPPRAQIAQARPGKLAYLFTGQGSQRVGMGKELYGAYPVFRQALDEACELLDQELDAEPLKEIILGTHPKADELLGETTYAQPALFALQVSLASLFSSKGIEPDLLAGHSVGEISAAHISGVLDLGDAAKLIAARGKLMGALPKEGAMVAIEATEPEVKEALEGKEGELSLAAVNGPSSCVISGTEKAVEEVASLFSEKGAKTKRLEVSHAFHSPLIEPMLAEFEELVARLQLGEPKLPILSGLTGEALSPDKATDPAYWVAHAREPVRFKDAIEGLEAQGASAYLELGPDPVLSAMAKECLTEQEPHTAHALREARNEKETLAEAISSIAAYGDHLDYQAFFKGSGARPVSLPTYPFQGTRYWLAFGAGNQDATAIGLTDPDHPLLGAVIEDPSGEGMTLTARLSLQTHPWLADHAVSGTVLFPATGFLELALAAAQRVGAQSVGELTIASPLLIAETAAVAVQITVSAPDEQSQREIQIHSRPEREEAQWALNAERLARRPSSPRARAPHPLATRREQSRSRSSSSMTASPRRASITAPPSRD